MRDRVTRGTLSLLTGMVFRKVIAFVYVMVAARVIPRSEFGIYVLFEATLVSLVLLSDFGLMVSSTRTIATEAEESEKLAAIGSAVLLRLVTVGGLSVLLIPARGLISHLYKSPALDLLMYYMPFALLATCMNDLFSYILLGQHKHKQMAIGQALSGIAGFAGVIGFVWMGRLGILGLVWTLILSCMVSLVYQYMAAGVKVPICYNLPMMKRLLRFGFPLHLNSILSLIFIRLDTYLIGLYTGPSALACYGIAMKLPDNVRQMFESYRLVYFSTTSQLYASNNHAEVQKTLETSIRWAAFILFAGTLGMVLFGNDVVRLIFSAKYLDSEPVLVLLMASTSFFICSTFLGTTIVAAGFPRRVVEIGVVSVIVNIGANLLWIPRFGYMGAAYASLLSNGVAAMVYLWAVKRAGIPFGISNLIKPVLMFTFAFGVFELCPWKTVPVKLLCAGMFLSGSILIGIVKGSDLTLLVASLLRKNGGISS